jgi:hypothetical protein
MYFISRDNRNIKYFPMQSRTFEHGETPVEGKQHLIEENKQSGQRRSQNNDNKEV